MPWWMRLWRPRSSIVDVSPMTIYIGYRTVRCIWLEREKRGYRLQHFAVAPLPASTLQVQPLRIRIEDPTALESAVREVLPAPPHPRRPTLVIPDASCIYMQLDVQDWPKRAEQQADLIQWQLRRHVRHDIHDFAVTWQVIHLAAAETVVGVLASWRPFLDGLETVLAAVGVTPSWILPENLVIDNLVWGAPQVRAELMHHRWMIVHWDRERLTATYFDGPRLRFKRSRTLPVRDADTERVTVLSRELILLGTYLQDFYGNALPEWALLDGDAADRVQTDVQPHVPFTLETLDVTHLYPHVPLPDDPVAWHPTLSMLGGTSP